MGHQRLPSLNYYNVQQKYVRTMFRLLFGSPVVSQPSPESAVITLTDFFLRMLKRTSTFLPLS